jgi:hypothetical protein
MQNSSDVRTNHLTTVHFSKICIGRPVFETVRMEPETEHSLLRESKSAPVRNSNCTYYLQSNQQEFPRSIVCIDGRAVRSSILCPSAFFSPKVFSLQRICIPSSIETICEGGSGGARVSRIWHSNPALNSAILATLRFRIALHLNRFAFLRQFK